MERAARHFQEELEKLKTRLLEMGGLAEERVRRAVHGPGRARRDADRRACSSATSRSTSCTSKSTTAASSCWRCTSRWPRTCARSSPRSRSTPTSNASATSRSTSPRRRSATRTHPPVKKLIDIPRMAEIAQAMLRDALDAFVRRDVGAGPARAERGRPARRAEDAGLPRAAHLHAAGSRHDRAGAGPDPGLAPSRADRRPRDERRRGRHLHGVGARRPSPRGGSEPGFERRAARRLRAPETHSPPTALVPPAHAPVEYVGVRVSAALCIRVAAGRSIRRWQAVLQRAVQAAGPGALGGRRVPRPCEPVRPDRPSRTTHRSPDRRSCSIPANRAWLTR